LKVSIFFELHFNKNLLLYWLIHLNGKDFAKHLFFGNKKINFNLYIFDMKIINTNSFNKYVFKRNFVLYRNSFILSYCKWKKILHIWMCDAPFTKNKFINGELLHSELLKISDNVYWIDIDENSIIYLQSKGINNLYCIDFTDTKNVDFLKEFNFDIIILWETMEHLENPWFFLDWLKKIMNNKTELLISVPNNFSLINNLYWIISQEHIHSDHKIWFSMWLLYQILSSKWFNINYYYFTFLKKPNFIINIWSIFFRIFPVFSNNLMVICQKSEK